MGQLGILSDNIDMINYIFKYLNLNEIKDFNGDWWWSSTEYSDYCSWCLYNGRTNNYNKVIDYNRIFPLFAVKNNLKL
ncbi:MAG: hypothetical protein [Wendovervirus sonii]|uniref:Uncharacterized protein n=1 Tax=phage Lak_Megaphage_Sonny TaxID=3109229 RepID=A0ABZ0Z2H9_9CAUD|nr:MAG: hypothetical protein [phage Lak_Megaphage_Sonny]